VTKQPEPKGKLDTENAATTVVGVSVNGPEDGFLDWTSVDWQKAGEDVRRLRQRIFTASQAGDLKKVRSLQKLMLRSRANALMSVRRVTEINAGRKTAGIDGRLALLPMDKADLAAWLQRRCVPWKARPVKRVFIPKANGKKLRPLGIPVIADRALQALVLGALEPEWEARFEPKSYGFRPGRGCHDAIAAIYATVKGSDTKRRWVLDADLAAAFDHIGHDHLLGQVGSFPARELIRQWLKAGVAEAGRFAPTEEGTPQGGVISPLLMNVALHGMEEAAGVRYLPPGPRAGRAKAGSPVLIRYADDLAVLCHSQEQAEQVKARLATWLRPRGLAFNEDKTRIVSLYEGFDFLGFNVRSYGGKLLIKPGKAAMLRIRERLRAEWKALRGHNAAAVLVRLNPVIRGWAAYYRIGVSSEAFHALDSHMWRLAFKWGKRSHPNKPPSWVTSRYFGAFNKARHDRWVFGDRDSGAYLRKFSWTSIARHQMVKGSSSPDDPSLAQYWAERRSRERPPLDQSTLRSLKQQRGRCLICGDFLLHASHQPSTPDEWARWLTATRKAITHASVTTRGQHGTPGHFHLVHIACQRHKIHANRQHSASAPRRP